MLKKFFILLIIGLYTYSWGCAQEMPFYKQYLMNNYLINPAITGFEDYTPITLIDKHQWIGMENAPSTQLFTLTGKIKKEGYGISIFNDNAGRFNTQSLQFSFSHHITIGKRKHFRRRTGRIVRERPELSFGFSFAAYRINLDQRGLTTNYPDPAISGKMETANFPEANFGIYYQKKGGFVSFSALNIIGAPVNLYDRDKETNRSNRQFALFFGKEAMVDKSLSVEPSVMLKANESFQFELDLNIKFLYLSSYWLALSYGRDANNLLEQNHKMKFFAGIEVFHAFHVAYSFTHRFNQMQTGTYGTHELMLRYHLFDTKKGNYYY